MPQDITYTWNLKYDTNGPIYETETDSQTQRADLWLPRGMGVGEGWTGSLRLAYTNYYKMFIHLYKMDKQQCPTVFNFLQ